MVISAFNLKICIKLEVEFNDKSLDDSDVTYY